MKKSLNDQIILLFDIDGVIIKPAAYRKGIEKTIKILCEQLGLPEFVPPEKTISRFESLGVHDVWDITSFRQISHQM